MNTTLENINVKIDQAQAVAKALRDILYEMEWKPETNHVPNLADSIVSYLGEIEDLVLTVRSEVENQK